ncbi:energy transducer TonB [Arcobacter sp.]|uniref:energy transducer TonB n=1 Tax=Arcobacter sp. TaxID=1872629 RepID=UPI003D11B6A3
MKYIILALILSISIHLLTFKTFKIKNDEILDSPSTSKNTKKSDIKYVTLKSSVKSVQQKKEEPKKSEEKKEIPKKTTKEKFQYKKVTKNQIEVAKKREVKKELPKKVEQQPIKQNEVIPNYTKLNPTKLQQGTLETFLANPPTDVKLLDELTQSYIKLYGEEYNSFTKVQKVFLEKNLTIFRNITQKTLNRLGYPRHAKRLKLTGSNIVEFIFHPDGSISNLKLTSKSEYEIFDKSTLELIEIAYKDYPRPKEPTKIKFNVIYTLY